MAKTLSKEDQEIRRKLTDDKRVKIYIGDPNVFHVEKILDIRAVTTEVEYLVKWKGYSAKHNKWVAEQDVTNDLKRTFSLQRKNKEVKRLSMDMKRLKEYRAKRNLRHQIARNTFEEADDVEFVELSEAVEKSTYSSTICESSVQEDNSNHQNSEGNSTFEFRLPPIESINQTIRKLSNEIENDFNDDASVLLLVESANVSHLSDDEDTKLLLGYDEFMQAVFE